MAVMFFMNNELQERVQRIHSRLERVLCHSIPGDEDIFVAVEELLDLLESDGDEEITIAWNDVEIQRRA